MAVTRRPMAFCVKPLVNKVRSTGQPALLCTYTYGPATSRGGGGTSKLRSRLDMTVYDSTALHFPDIKEGIAQWSSIQSSYVLCVRSLFFFFYV